MNKYIVSRTSIKNSCIRREDKSPCEGAERHDSVRYAYGKSFQDTYWTIDAERTNHLYKLIKEERHYEHR